ncbi:hypothetical protein HDU67_005622, partial [Dinochytrium kinnereticum]
VNELVFGCISRDIQNSVKINMITIAPSLSRINLPRSTSSHGEIYSRNIKNSVKINMITIAPSLSKINNLPRFTSSRGEIAR